MGIMHVIPCSTYTHAVHYAHDMLHDKFTYKINFLISIKIFLSHLSIHTFSYILNLCIMRMINAHVHDAHDMLQKCAFCPSLVTISLKIRDVIRVWKTRFNRVWDKNYLNRVLWSCEFTKTQNGPICSNRIWSWFLSIGMQNFLLIT